jgi:hypothetical protein
MEFWTLKVTAILEYIKFVIWPPFDRLKHVVIESALRSSFRGPVAGNVAGSMNLPFPKD